MRDWISSNPDEESDALYSHIRLPLIRIDELLDIVRPSGLIPADVILDAIRVIETINLLIINNFSSNLIFLCYSSGTTFEKRYGAQIQRIPL